MTAMAQHLKVWKTIKLGYRRTTAGYRAALRQEGVQITGWASDAISKIPFFSGMSEKEVDLVIASITELGFKGQTRHREICERIADYGLALCPAEVGPALRLQYTDQPDEEWLQIAMEPINAAHEGTSTYPDTFSIVNDKETLWLRGNGCTSQHAAWDDNRRFIFLKPSEPSETKLPAADITT